ncbi:hypothetical protein CC2G_011316 [Coprinopsis cinerea AmutBmut pab1-1]|nr:hypothetical protein CC2G_011316 [Coprinopsis cinerea AmutBmut pab1-1]
MGRPHDHHLREFIPPSIAICALTNRPIARFLFACTTYHLALSTETRSCGTRPSYANSQRSRSLQVQQGNATTWAGSSIALEL